jgi:hypothetical protein
MKLTLLVHILTPAAWSLPMEIAAMLMALASQREAA